MSRIRGKDTKPELFVRRALHALGYRFRTHLCEVPGTPDLVFSKRRMAVFVHGCFWHRYGCGRIYLPKSRQVFWRTKFAENIERDRRVRAQLAQSGWPVFVACEIETDETAIARLVAFLGPPRAPDHPEREEHSHPHSGNRTSTPIDLLHA